MSFNSFSSSVKLDGIKTYNSVNKTANKSFKNTFYSDIKEIDYSQYEEIDYNVLEERIEQVECEDVNTVQDYTQTIQVSFVRSVLSTVVSVVENTLNSRAKTTSKLTSLLKNIFSMFENVESKISNLFEFLSKKNEKRKKKESDTVDKTVVELDFTQNEFVINLDNQLKQLETEKSRLDRLNKTTTIPGFTNMTLEKQIILLDSQIAQLKNNKKALINYLSEMGYSNLQNNSDFESTIQSDLTTEEAEQLYELLNLAYSGNTYPSSEELNSCESIKVFLDKNNLNYYNNEKWEKIEKIYEKGFNIYEVAMKCNTLIDNSFSGALSIQIPCGSYCNFGYFAHALNYMTQEEKNIILYLANTAGTKEVDKYLAFKQEELNSRIGFCRASMFFANLQDESDIGKFLKTTLKGTDDGVENFFKGLNNALLGIDSVVSPEQYETMYIISCMSGEQIDSLDFLTEEERNKLKEIKGVSSNKFLQDTYEVSFGIGNMLPAITASTITSIVATPAVGKVVGMASMALSSGGNAAENLYQQGYSFWQSIIYGTLNGASETTLGYFLGGIPGLSNISKLPGFKGFLTNIVKEGLEESLQAILDPYLMSLATGTKHEFNWDEVSKAGIYGFITAAILNGGNVVINKVVNVVMDGVDLVINGVKIPTNKLNDPEYMNKIILEIVNQENGIQSIIELQRSKLINLRDCSLEIKSEIYNKLKNEGYLGGVYPVPESLFTKYIYVYMNSKYFDIENNEILLPGGEGSDQYSLENLKKAAEQLEIQNYDKLTHNELFIAVAQNGALEVLIKMGAKQIELSTNKGKDLGRVTTNSVEYDEGQFFGNITDDILSRELSPFITENGKLNKFKLTGFDGTQAENKTITVNGERMTVGKNCKIVCMQTNATPFYHETGGAEQYVFYITDMEGNLLTEMVNGELQLAKAKNTDLIKLGIIEYQEEGTL